MRTARRHAGWIGFEDGGRDRFIEAPVAPSYFHRNLFAGQRVGDKHRLALITPHAAAFVRQAIDGEFVVAGEIPFGAHATQAARKASKCGLWASAR